MSATTGHRAFRWDIDKTYLATDFESLRRMLRLPFEKGSDKVAIAGAAALIRELTRSAGLSGERPSLSFITASPRQIAGPILEKLAIDGIEHDGVVFKDQMHHLVRGRFAALREQVGFKLSQLLAGALVAAPGTREVLFGDDWESDPFVYSLYADILAGRLDEAEALDLLAMCGVHRYYGDSVLEALARLAVAESRPRVDFVCILRQRLVPAARLDLFGKRLVWFDDYFECSLRLHLLGLLDEQGVGAVARDIGRGPGHNAAVFDAVCSRGENFRERMSPLRRRLVSDGIMAEVSAGSRLGRLRATLGRRPVQAETAVPDYRALVVDWSRRRRKEADRRG